MMFRTIRRVARRFGLEIAGARPETSAALRMQLLLRTRRIDLVLDVGAHRGQYGRWLREIGYRGMIVSIEPQPQLQPVLVRGARHDPQWRVLPPLALGDHDGSAELHLAANEESSSLAEMLPAHRVAAPQASYVGMTPVQVRRLDSLAPALLGQAQSPLLKLDVQGYEARVLAGAARSLAQFSALQLEVALTPLYAGELTLGPMLADLERRGFGLHSLTPGFSDRRDGRTLQVDALFVRL
ncbi:MAG: FkbM family methyltransferase [Oscillochloris sp.]|nr:FkbM family methyltransferase [Oscillochloris sp.]